MAAYVASRMLATPATPGWTNIDEHASTADSTTLYNGISRLHRRDGELATIGIVLGSLFCALCIMSCCVCRYQRRRAIRDARMRHDARMQNGTSMRYWADNPPRDRHHRRSQRGSRARRGGDVELQRLG